MDAILFCTIVSWCYIALFCMSFVSAVIHNSRTSTKVGLRSEMRINPPFVLLLIAAVSFLIASS